MPNMWMIRAGRGSEDIEAFLSGGIVTLGDGRLGALSLTMRREDLLRLYAEKYPEEKAGSRSTWAGQRRPRPAAGLPVRAPLGTAARVASPGAPEVLADPLRHVVPAPDAGAGRPPADPRLSAGGNELRRSLLGWDGAAWRLERSLVTHAPTGLRAPEARLLAPLLGQALQAGRLSIRDLPRLTTSPAPTTLGAPGGSRGRTCSSGCGRKTFWYANSAAARCG